MTFYTLTCRLSWYATGRQKSDLLQGTLDVLILKVVALGPIHGYAIAQRLQQMSGAVLQVQQGSLYPALHRLEKRRWLAAEWAASETGREARFYTLTQARPQAARGAARELGSAVGGDLRRAQHGGVTSCGSASVVTRVCATRSGSTATG